MTFRDDWEKYTGVDRARLVSEGGYLFIGAATEFAQQITAVVEATKISADEAAKVVQAFRELNARRRAPMDRKTRHRARYERMMGRRH